MSGIAVGLKGKRGFIVTKKAREDRPSRRRGVSFHQHITCSSHRPIDHNTTLPYLLPTFYLPPTIPSSYTLSYTNIDMIYDH
jgi:hypothetical protein